MVRAEERRTGTEETVAVPDRGRRWRIVRPVGRSRYRTDVRVVWGCVVSTGSCSRRTRAEVPSGLVKQAAKRSTWQPPVDSRPRRLGGKVSVEATSGPRGGGA